MVDVRESEVLKKKNDDGRSRLHQYFFVAVDVDCEGDGVLQKTVPAHLY